MLTSDFVFMPGYDAIIIGGGPAGSSAAISLSQRGARVLLLEEKRMPRGKLCGEFITPECFPTLERLGVMRRMLEAGAQKIEHVSLIVASGKSVQTRISDMSDAESTWAMSLSRARFDQILFDRAREAGADCLEGIAVRGCAVDEAGTGRVEALSLKEGKKVTLEAPTIIDASGRNSRLMVGKRERVAGRRGSRLFALKAHFRGIRGIDDRVELYFFPEGYGGLSNVEDGLVNLCFIVGERALREAGGNPSKVVDSTLMNNPLASERLREARIEGKWYSAGPLTFGRRRLAREGVIAIGDASGMIDPFTGTGVQMALRTGEMAADAIVEALGDGRSAIVGEDGLRRSTNLESVLACYARHYKQEFHNRMRVAGLLRMAAFSPPTASIVASVLARMPRLTNLVFRATRGGNVSRTVTE
jgi:geranylgeranyl reductase family protein